jgi:hypothetical protein
LRGWHWVSVTEHRMMVDWAHVIKALVDQHYPDAERIVLVQDDVQDNLNTHTLGSLNEAFPPVEARRLAQKLELHYTPKHGSWLNITEIELSKAPAKDVFQKDLSNAVMEPSAWVFDAEGVLTPAPKGHGDIWTKERYGNFILELDFKVPEKGNSGVFIRTGDIKKWINTAIEIQIHATTDGANHGECGAVYNCLSPSKNANKGPNEWNHYVITCLDNKIYINLNGQDIIDMDLNKWTEAGKNPDGTPNKFKTAYKDMPRVGNLGFQYHGNPVWFKNLKVKSLD